MLLLATLRILLEFLFFFSVNIQFKWLIIYIAMVVLSMHAFRNLINFPIK